MESMSALAQSDVILPITVNEIFNVHKVSEAVNILFFNYFLMKLLSFVIALIYINLLIH